MATAPHSGPSSHTTPAPAGTPTHTTPAPAPASETAPENVEKSEEDYILDCLEGFGTLVVRLVLTKTRTGGQNKVLRGLSWVVKGLEELKCIEEGLLPFVDVMAEIGLLPSPIPKGMQTDPRPPRKTEKPGTKPGKSTKPKKDASVSDGTPKQKDKTKNATPAEKGKGKQTGPADKGKGKQTEPAEKGKGKQTESAEKSKAKKTGPSDKGKAKNTGPAGKGRAKNTGSADKGKAKQTEPVEKGKTKKHGGSGKDTKTMAKGKKPTSAAGGGEKASARSPALPVPRVGVEGTAIVVHGVPSYQLLSDLSTKLLLSPEGTEVKSLRWLLPGAKRVGKKASSLVLYLNTDKVPEDLVVRLSKKKMRTTQYECDRGKPDEDSGESTPKPLNKPEATAGETPEVAEISTQQVEETLVQIEEPTPQPQIPKPQPQIPKPQIPKPQPQIPDCSQQ